ETIYGGADINECFQTAGRIEEGNYESWFREWLRTAERIHGIAEGCLRRGHTASAREAFLRASNYYRCAEFFMHMEIGRPDARAMETYENSVECFRQGMLLADFPCERVKIPYEGTTLPGYFYPASDSNSPHPTLLIHGGYDSTGEEQYIETVPAARARGYHCLVFEGPGQGSVIRRQKLPFRPDWEAVVSPVVDYVLTRNEVDPKQIILLGKSLGGLLAPRAAAFEHRLAACVAVDGLFSLIPESYAQALSGATMPDEQLNAFLEQEMQANGNTRWAISQGMWTLQAASLAECVRKMQPYNLEKVAGLVACPTLVCDAEADHAFAGQPEKLYEALRCPRTLLRFTVEDAAEEHCHAGATLLLNQRLFDWLDETIQGADPCIS
ncbi:MAG TPA: alpha/beta fold hydrolase, partial [Anaerolineales bacterium]|nr:alpha/beta fold hydrolase [Anaerolineales bacterium]